MRTRRQRRITPSFHSGRVLAFLVVLLSGCFLYYDGGSAWVYSVAFALVISIFEIRNLSKEAGAAVTPHLLVFVAVLLFSSFAAIELRKSYSGSVGLIMTFVSVFFYEVSGYVLKLLSEARLFFADRMSGSGLYVAKILFSFSQVFRFLFAVFVFVRVGLYDGVAMEHAIPIALVCIIFSSAGNRLLGMIKREAGVDTDVAFSFKAVVLDISSGFVFGLFGFALAMTWSLT